MQCQTCQLAMVKTHNRVERETDLRGGVAPTRCVHIQFSIGGNARGFWVFLTVA